VALSALDNKYKAIADGLFEEKLVMKANMTKLETNFANYKEKHEIQVGLILNSGNKDKEIETLGKRMEGFQDARKSAEKLCNARRRKHPRHWSWPPSIVILGERTSMRSLLGWMEELIAKSQEVEQDYEVVVLHGFKNPVVYIKALERESRWTPRNCIYWRVWLMPNYSPQMVLRRRKMRKKNKIRIK
jgi:hypothetical protein